MTSKYKWFTSFALWFPKIAIGWFSHWAVSDSVQPYGLQPTRLLCPWDSPGRNTGAGCHFLLQNCHIYANIFMILQMGILGALEGGRLGAKAPFFVWAPWGVCVKQCCLRTAAPNQQHHFFFFCHFIVFSWMIIVLQNFVVWKPEPRENKQVVQIHTISLSRRPHPRWWNSTRIWSSDSSQLSVHDPGFLSGLERGHLLSGIFLW